MQGARGGYTIVEVIIVLAISGALFAAAVTVFGGKQGRTQFTQAMQDVDSQIRSMVNDVGVSLYPEAGQYSCSISGSGRAVLTATPTGVATNGACIYLGEAFQADTSAGAGKIYSYTVLGRRLSSGNVVTSFSDANPEPAIDPASGSGNTLLRETYVIGADTHIAWSKVSTSLSAPAASAPETDLVGFYNNLQSTSASGKQSVLSYGYTGFSTASGNSVKTAVETTVPPTQIQSWYMCFESGSSSQFAQLIVYATSVGISTKTNYVSTC
jgi:prepilin-type N-terminal cleavage/methylation domain-containing protein